MYVCGSKTDENSHGYTTIGVSFFFFLFPSLTEACAIGLDSPTSALGVHSYSPLHAASLGDRRHRLCIRSQMIDLRWHPYLLMSERRWCSASHQLHDFNKVLPQCVDIGMIGSPMMEC